MAGSSKQTSESTSAQRVVLVSCVKRKCAHPAAARDLYISPLFVLMRSYAERCANLWFILSAEHGLLDPSQVIAPYERTLNEMPKMERAAWVANVERQLRGIAVPGAEFVMLAGKRYREGLVPFLRGRGCTVRVPMEGKRLGMQLKWLKEQVDGRARI